MEQAVTPASGQSTDANQVRVGIDGVNDDPEIQRLVEELANTPIPAALVLRPTISNNGEPVTLVIGVIPRRIDKDERDLFMQCNLIFVPRRTWRNRRYEMWDAQDIITHGGRWACPTCR